MCPTTDPTEGVVAVGSPFLKRIRTPGNLNTSFAPSLPGTPPIAVQNFLPASTSCTIKWTWPMLTPASLGGASCAHDVRAGHRIATARKRISFFIEDSLVFADPKRSERRDSEKHSLNVCAKTYGSGT